MPRQEKAERILEISLQDAASSWELQPDGSWTPRRGGLSSQQRFIEIAREEAIRMVGGYDEGVVRAASSRKKSKRKKGR